MISDYSSDYGSDYHPGDYSDYSDYGPGLPRVSRGFSLFPGSVRAWSRFPMGGGQLVAAVFGESHLEALGGVWRSGGY